MTEEEFLGLITIMSMLGLGIIAVIWWIGTDIIHELRYRNFLLKEQNQNKMKTIKEIEKRITEIETKKGVVSNEEIK